MAKIAIPIANGFEDSELTVPRDRLRERGHDVTLIGPRSGEVVVGKNRKASVTITRQAKQAQASHFDALFIPGGYSPDHLRTDPEVVRFVREFFESGKLVAAICHGPQLLIEAEVVKGRHLTSWPSVRKDLENAGAEWEDRSVVVDENLITSRNPDDLDDFCEAMLARLGDSHRAATA